MNVNTMNENQNKLYFSIGEVSEMLGVNTSKLRFWEKEFPSLKPAKYPNGTRFYTRENVTLLQRIMYLTESCGYTLDGAREQIRLDKVPDKKLEVVNTLTDVRSFLVKLKDEL